MRATLVPGATVASIGLI